jgi:glycosyltransferase involved in cell wall biosynthesis
MAVTDLALFMPSFAGGGAERVFLDIGRGFAERGVAVDLVLVKDEGPLAGQVPDGVRVVPLGARRAVTSVPALRRYLRRVRPEAMLTALTHANIVAVAAREAARVPTRIAVTEHLPPSTWVEASVRREAPLMPRLMRLAYGRAAVIAVSGGVADDLARRTGIARDRIHVIYNPVVIERIAARAAGPPPPGLPAGAGPLVLAVGRLTRQKDFPTLLRAFARLGAERGVRLAILGEGEERPALEALMAELRIGDRVALPGFVENPYPAFRSAALLAMSSRWEGLPTVLLEAVSLGVPVVSTDCPSGPSEILAGGRFGRLVPMGDPGALADAIASALDDPLRPPPEAAAPYRLDAVVDAYAEVLGLEPAPAPRAAA